MTNFFRVIFLTLAAFQSISFANPYASDQKFDLQCGDKKCIEIEYNRQSEQNIIRKGEKIIEDINNGPDDKERWSFVVLFSGKGDDKIQSIDLIRRNNFSMTLNPPRGWLTFSTKLGDHTFKISPPGAGTDEICPNYQIHVVEAGAGYALIRKNCTRNEYRPGRYSMSNDYYLYDEVSRTLRSIWSAATVTASAKYPAAKPEPQVNLIKHGYQFNWTGVFPTDGVSEKIAIKNLYKRESDKNGVAKLVCYDALNSQKIKKEGDMCIGDILERVSNDRK